MKICRKFVLLAVLTVALCALLCLSASAAGSGIMDVRIEPAFTSSVRIVPQTIENVPVTAETVTVGGSSYDFYPDAEKASVTYSDAVDGSYYLLLLLTDDSGIPTEGNTEFIDQRTAAASSVSVTALPGTPVDGKTYYIFLASNSVSGGISALTLVGSFRYHAELLPGDVNGDGTVDAVDALRVLRHVVGLVTLTEEQTLAADVDRNGAVEAVDALRILRYAVGSLSSLD